MPPPRPRDAKAAALRQQGSLNRRPQAVRDPLFASDQFFDPRDLVQVKYEMLRRVRVDGQTVSQSAKNFGLSRPVFYHAQAALQDGGLPALIAKKPGPRRAHKLGATIMEFLRQALSEEPALRATQLADRVRSRFGYAVHPRSIERALKRQEKKRP
jgi:transposase